MSCVRYRQSCRVVRLDTRYFAARWARALQRLVEKSRSVSLTAFFSDIHGNSQALARVLDVCAEMGVQDQFFLGDAVGYGHETEAVLERLLNSGACCQKGNHESRVLAFGDDIQDDSREAIYQHGRAKQELSAIQIERLASWPQRREILLGSYRGLLVHGSPKDELNDYLYPDSDLDCCKGLEMDFVVTAHTHRPFVRVAGTTRVVNAGSVGLPRDVGNLASFALFDDSTGEFRICRVRIDTEEYLARWGDELHYSVVAVLGRRGQAFVGDVHDG